MNAMILKGSLQCLARAIALAIGVIAMPASALGGTLDDVRARGRLICGVSEGLQGFSTRRRRVVARLRRRFLPCCWQPPSSTTRRRSSSSRIRPLPLRRPEEGRDRRAVAQQHLDDVARP